MEEQLSEIYKAENELYKAEKDQEQDWPKVFAQYKELYRRFPVQKVAIHFAFFCWYLLWQWDEIVFPGEKPSSHERAALDMRGGMSTSELYSSLNCMSSQQALIVGGRDRGQISCDFDPYAPYLSVLF